MSVKTINAIIKYVAVIVWIANGLFCKVLNLVPRHELIVTRILGVSHAHLLTKAIGISEIIMAVWIASGIKSRFNTIVS